MIDTSIIDDPMLVELADYWDAKRLGQIAPSRLDLDPLEIPHLLPIMGLIDVLDEGRSFRYRLVGTRVSSAFGRDPTHNEVADTFSRDDAYTLYIRDILRRTASEIAPRYTKTEYVREFGEPVFAERLTMPLVDEQGLSNIILVGTVFSEKSRTAILPPHCMVFHGLANCALETLADVAQVG